MNPDPVAAWKAWRDQLVAAWKAKAILAFRRLRGKASTIRRKL